MPSFIFSHPRWLWGTPERATPSQPDEVGRALLQPVPIMQRFAGHTDVATTMRYCSIADDVYEDRIVKALD